MIYVKENMNRAQTQTLTALWRKLLPYSSKKVTTWTEFPGDQVYKLPSAIFRNIFDKILVENNLERTYFQSLTPSGKKNFISYLESFETPAKTKYICMRRGRMRKIFISASS